MSKPSSNLVFNTKGDKSLKKIISNRLKQLTYEKIKVRISTTKTGKTKSAIVGAYDIRTNKIVVAFAGPIPKIIHPELIKRADKIGGIGTHGKTKRNTIGVCAEFHVINKLLLNGSDISNIRLVKAIRPRTGKPIPYCKNCEEMFKDILRRI